MPDEMKYEERTKVGYIHYGYRVEIEHWSGDNYLDTADLVPLGQETLKAMYQESIEKESQLFAKIGDLIDLWKEQAAITRGCNRALEYFRVPEVDHTYNEWILGSDNSHGNISNRVYAMEWKIFENTQYDFNTNQYIPVSWDVSWTFAIRSPIKEYKVIIAGQRKKRYTSKEEALKYLDGRKKAYAPYFTELSPIIPKQYREHFMIHGIPLPDYIIEGMEPRQFNTGKPSVLEQLNETKPESRAASSPSTEKKKEDIAL